MKKALFKETLRSISRSKARFISIIAIVALGISFFAGIKATAPDMKETAELYVQDTNMMDVRVISQAGLTEEDLEAMQQIDGVDTIVPGRFVDGILQADGKSIGDMDGSEMTVRAMGLDFAQAFDYAETGEASADYMNRVTLLEGRMPENENECLVDGSTLSAPEQFKVGAKIGIAGDGTNIENKMDVTEFTIVGIVRTPLYLSFERGYTNVGSGKLGTFIYVSNDVFNFDYYTEAYMTVSGAANYSTYSEEYDEFITPVVEALKDLESVRLPLRIEALREEYTPIVADGEAELAEQEANYDQQVADAEAQIAEMKDLAENGQAEIDAKKKEFNDSLSAAQKEIYDGTDEYNSQYAEWREKYDQLNEAKLNLTKLETATDDYNSAKAQLDNAKSQIDSANQQIEATEEIVVGLNNSLEYFQNYQNDQEQTIKDWITGVGLPEDVVDTIYDSFSSLTAMGTAEEMIAYMEPMLKQYNETLNQQKQQLAQATAEYNENKAKLDAASAIISQYQNAKQEVTEAEIELEEYERQLNDAGVDLKVGQLELNSNQQQLQSQISMAEMQLAAAQTQLETAEAELEAQKQSGAEELEKARMDLKEAQDLLASLDTAEWMIQNRDDQPGFAGYEQTADRMDALAQVFPIFFFLVAALVCLTTMTRMVEEERTQLGTLKALGYSSGAIASKYLIYSLSASLIGSVIGLALGFVVFPTAISAAFGIMYDLPQCVLRFKWDYALIGTVISLLCTTAAALIACRKELIENPAKLMRPKPPKKGKRILLEKITFIWSRMNFTSKVTARNLFRNKRRFFTTLIGVAGCTALLLTGFGLGDSIGAIMTNQFGEDGISQYDVQIVLNQEYDGTEDPEPVKQITSRAEIQNAMMTQMDAINASSDRTDDVLEINLLVPREPAELSKFIKLEDCDTHEAVSLNDSGVIITEKLADQTDTQPGDYITLTVNNQDYSVPVTAIVENYTFHYVYMSPTMYQSIFGEAPAYSYVVATLGNDVSAAQKDSLATDLMKVTGIDAVAYTTATIDTFETTIDSLNLVVVVFIVAAGALAFVVLYNLANLNLNERVREVATIKVLGFRDKEVSAYIVRENIILTIIGVILGLVLGIFLHRFVISAISVDVVMFGKTVAPLSYLYAALLSFVFAALVNLIVHKKLRKVNMVESLKAVE